MGYAAPRAKAVGATAGGGRGEMGGLVCGQRDQSDQAADRRLAVASRTSNYVLPVSGPAYAASRVAVARARTWPSRIA
jgi:hypothetical protein